MGIKALLKTITKKEWRFVILLSVAVILITAIPYLYAYLNPPQGQFYFGLHSLISGDSTVYYSYINQIKEGNFVLRDYFTSEAQPSGLINFFWLKVGLFARLFNLRADIAFHLCRLFLIPVFLATIYVFISYFFSQASKRKFAILFVCFSSGIGAYFAVVLDKIFPYIKNLLIYKWPIDLWAPESNIFLILYQAPHLILSLTLMVAFFLLLLLALENNNYYYSLGAGLVGLVWFNFHPYSFVSVFIILFVYVLFLTLKNKNFKLFCHYFLALILSSPFIIYHYYKIKTDFVIGSRASQNICLTPPFVFILLGYGFLFLLATLCLICFLKKKIIFKNDKYLFLSLWFVLTFLIIYLPINFQSRFLLGVHIPMILLAIIFLFNLRQYLNTKLSITLSGYFLNNKSLLIILFLILFCFSNIFNLTRDLYYFVNQKSIFYLPDEYLNAIDWLKNNNKDDKVILSFEANGLFIPAFAAQHVYLGHGHETINNQLKNKIVNDFFADQYDEDKAKQFLTENNISYIFFTDLERKKASYQPLDKKYLEQAWQKGEIEIFQVKF